MQLVIYVEEGCFGCARARQIAGEIGRRHDSIDVSILDLSEVSTLPEEVIAVPAYVLDGRLVSLGNPYLSEITALIEQGLGEEARHENAEKT
jgi:hypothetical protein